MDAETVNILTLLASFLVGGGGLTALYKAKQQAPLIGAQAQSVVIADLLAENTRLSNLVEELRLSNRELRDHVADLEDRLKRAGI